MAFCLGNFTISPEGNKFKCRIAAYKICAVPPTHLSFCLSLSSSSSSSSLLASSSWISLPGVSTWELPLWQHTSCLATGPQVELTSQESGEGFDNSKGIMRGHFVVHSNCQFSHEDAKCHIRPEKQKVPGVKGSPFYRPHVKYELQRLCDDKLCRYKWPQELPLSDPAPTLLIASQMKSEREKYIFLPLLMYLTWISSSLLFI